MSERPDSSIEQVTALLHEMERDLASLQTEVDHGQRLSLVGTLAAGVAHEVNNLLTPARGYAQMLCDDDLDAALRRKAAGRVTDAIDAAARILEAVLEFSASGAIDETADVGETLQDAIDCLGGDLSRQGIRMIRSVPPGTRVAMTPIELQQVLLNLLLNARTALATRGGSLVVSAAERGDGSTLITVTDDGPGIPVAIADAIFEPFVSGAGRAGDSSGRSAGRRGGYGLGLAVCRRLIENANGSIAVTSRPGEGASFTVIVPTAKRVPCAKAG